MSDSSLPSRWRFSIRTLLGCTVILALVITVWLQWRELTELRQEVKVLREEGGHLIIDDPGRLHAIDVAIPADDHWRWRVHVPETGRYQLCFQQGRIPIEGLPAIESDRMTFPLEPGEHRLDLAIEFKSGDLPQHLATLSMPNGRQGMLELYETTEEWLDTPGATVNRLAEEATLGNRTASFSPGEPAVLLRYRAQKLSIANPPPGGGRAKVSYETVATPSDGLMLWIERIP